MAQKVKYRELSNPRLVAVHYPWNPFIKEEIERLTKKLSKFALVLEGDFLFIYGE